MGILLNLVLCLPFTFLSLADRYLNLVNWLHIRVGLLLMFLLWNYGPIFDVVTTWQQKDCYIMADIFKIRINNSIVQNLVMNVDDSLELRPHKIWAT